MYDVPGASQVTSRSGSSCTTVTGAARKISSRQTCRIKTCAPGANGFATGRECRLSATMAEIDVLAAPAAATEPAQAPDVSVVVPIYDEEASVDELYRRTVDALEAAGLEFELIFVDDGSRDGTFARLERLHDADPRVRVVRFKRNFGQHPAMHAGLARGRAATSS